MSPMLYTVAHGVIPPVARAVWRPKVEGLHHVPSSGPVIVASNHLSFFDSVVIPVVVPRKVVFLAKSDYFTGTWCRPSTFGRHTARATGGMTPCATV